MEYDVLLKCFQIAFNQYIFTKLLDNWNLHCVFCMNNFGTKIYPREWKIAKGLTEQFLPLQWKTENPNIVLFY